jgi:ATP-binding cassette, subfamily B, bacterial MsbA
MIELIKTLLSYIAPFKGKIIASVILSFCLASIKFAQAYLVKPIFDHGLSEAATFQQAMILSGILLTLGVINFPCRFYHFYWIRYVVDAATCSIREEIFKKLQGLPIDYYNKAKQGQLISLMLNDTQIFAQGLKSSVDLIREPLTAAFMLGLAIYRDWQLTGVIFLVTPLFIIIFMKSGKKVRVNQGRVQEELSEMAHVVSEGIVGQKVTKAFNLQEYVIQRFRNEQKKFFGAQMDTTHSEEVAHPLVEFVGAIAFSGVILFAHHRISSGAMTTGDFVSFITALALLMDPIRKFSQANIKINQSRAAGERIFKLLDTEEEVSGQDMGIPHFTDKIEVENLTFSYGDHQVIKNLNLTIKKGEKVGLVGLSGSGKSTLVHLLLGLYPITEGDIKIDGHSIKNWKLKSLRNLFAFVGQDVFLFNDTIRENLCLGEDLSQADIDRALEVSYATEFVKTMPEKLNSEVGERGAKLSGGQKQRVTIARAFLKDADVLLFDEATSSLDNESEKIVQKALEKLTIGKTVLAVAHRLSTIQNFDKIYVLSEGRIVESGNHLQLMEKSGQYARLYELGN